MHNAMWLKDVLVYLVAAGILIPLFHRARVSAVVGFIALGALLGPHGLGQWAGQAPALSYLTITDQHRAAQFGELGVIFLLFLLGLEFSAEKLWALRREVFGLGLLQVVFSGTLLAIGLRVSGVATDLALVTGVALAMSSTALVMQILVSERRATAPIGKTALAILLFQDLAVVAVLLAAELIGGPVHNLWLVVGLALLKGVAAVGIILLAGRFVLAPLVGAAARTGARDLLMAVTLVVVAGTAGLTEAAGLSAALGAFLSGMMLSGTVYQHQISVDLEPFKGLLIGVFFVSVGMGVDLSAILPVLHWVLVAAAAVILAKFIATYGAARLLKVEAPLAGELALLLSQTGEFAFVVLGLLQTKGVLDGAAAGFIVAVVTLTLVLTPWLAQAGGLVRVRLERVRQDAQAFAAPEGGHVVIGGFGRVGRIVAESLEAQGVPFVALDADATRVGLERAAGRQVFLGDASREEILARVAVERASAVVVTLDEAHAAEGMVRATLRLKADAVVLARVKDAPHARRLAALGARDVIPEAVEASLHLAGLVLRNLGRSEEEVMAHLDAARARERARLTEGD
ncbi:cation:proton antiporter [Aquabacter sp. L1I39]|uniref:cation:proton antiporter domain-containing protein n=1 Tax=Aquabacter sp. L1I39 TaxID=2820278 RepID=UPI001AD9862D|nr:cation:proton antiporter [Aquabacter sp. L1I39]QTL05598.1 cation:proton antiporter [Aquabacter sp. L1I39]